MSLVNKINFRKQIISIVLLVLVSVFLSGCAEEEQREKIYQVGILSGAEQFANTIDIFKAKMTELGYVEGQNIVYDVHRLNDDPAGEKRISEQFVQDDVDLILAFPLEAALSAKAATEGTDIPVVFAWSPTEGTGLIESVQHPGGHVTGVRHYNDDLMLKRFEYLLELAPDAKRIWTIYDPQIAPAVDSLTYINELSASKGVEIVETQIASVDDVKAEIERRSSLDDIGVDAIMLMPDANTNAPEGFGMLLEFANENKIPVSALIDWQVGEGALYTFTPIPDRYATLMASQVDKIFKGTPAGDIPVVTCDGSLWINYKVAQELGLDVSENLLSVADKIIR